MYHKVPPAEGLHWVNVSPKEKSKQMQIWFGSGDNHTGKGKCHTWGIGQGVYCAPFRTKECGAHN